MSHAVAALSPALHLLRHHRMPCWQFKNGQKSPFPIIRAMAPYVKDVYDKVTYQLSGLRGRRGARSILNQFSDQTKRHSPSFEADKQTSRPCLHPDATRHGLHSGHSGLQFSAAKTRHSRSS